MRARWQIAASLAACALLLTASARAEDAAQSPVELVGKLQNSQAEIAQGSLVAYSAQFRILREISEALSATKPEVWKNSRNARAAIIYLLSGGQPHIVEGLLNSGNISKDDEKLARGALDYVLGHEAEARQLLGDVDPKSLEPSLGGQIAFVQSILLTAVDTKKAIALLDMARLLAPGGLVEEAALRREVFVVGDMAHDGDRFLSLAAKYATRFPRSPYAENFVKGFTATLIRLRLYEDVGNFQKLESVAESLSQDDRRGLFLTIARAALVNGKIAMADVAASTALTLAQADSADEARGRLYQSAARSVTDQYESGVIQLQGIDSKKLPKRDAPLLAAARAVAKRIREQTNPPAAAAAPPTAPDDSAAATIHLAEAALSKSQQPFSEGVP
jgi:chemotaxis protein MotC